MTDQGPTNNILTIIAIILMWVFVLLVFCYWTTGCGYSEAEMQMARDRMMQQEMALEKCWERNPVKPEELGVDPGRK